MIPDIPLRLKSAIGVDDEPVEMYELPKTLRVIKYSLEFEPFFPFPNFSYNGKTYKKWNNLQQKFLEPNLSFKGYIESQFVMIKQSSTVWLNSERLKIQKINLFMIENGQEKKVKFTHLLQNNFLVLKVNDGFKLGKTYLLKTNYTGQFYEAEQKGIFHKTYKSSDGSKK